MKGAIICMEDEGTKRRCRKHANDRYHFWCNTHGAEHEQDFFENYLQAAKEL